MNKITQVWLKVPADDRWRVILSLGSILLAFILLLNAVLVEKDVGAVNTFIVGFLWVGAQLVSLVSWATSTIASESYDDTTGSWLMWLCVFVHLACLVLWFVLSRVSV